MRLVTLVVLSLAAAACAAQRPGGPLAPLTGKPCGVDRVPEQFAAWNEVAGDGFTFCVPSTWTAVDPQGRRWRSADVDFSWGDRTPHSDRRLPLGSRRVGAPDRIDQPISEAHPDTKLVLSETIDGQTVRLTLEHPAGRYTRAATELLEPVLYLNAVARTSAAVHEIVAAYRSIRYIRKS